MQSLIKGDVVSVLAIVAYDYSYEDAKSNAITGGVGVRVIGPQYSHSPTFAKLENVSLVTPVIKIGDIVSTGRVDWSVLAIVADYLWLSRMNDGSLQHCTFHISAVHRKDKAEAQTEMPLEEAPPAERPPIWSPLRATDAKLAEILGMEQDELTGAASKNELEQWEIQTIDGIWTRDTGPGPIGLWTYAAFVPPVSEVEF